MPNLLLFAATIVAIPSGVFSSKKAAVVAKTSLVLVNVSFVLGLIVNSCFISTEVSLFKNVLYCVIMCPVMMCYCRSSVVIDNSRSFGADPLLFDYVLREVNPSTLVHVVPARRLT